MYRGKRIAVVVPAHNEERLIARTIATMPELVDHVVVVDDASTDGTAAAVRAITDTRVEVVSLRRNQGVGGAILTGHRRVCETGADISVVMVGDGQMDPAYLPALLDPLCDGTHEFSKGNRLIKGSSRHGMPRTRVIGNFVMSALIKPASGYWHISDPLNGYTAVTVAMLRRLPLDRIRLDYSFEPDILIRLNIAGARVADIPIPAIYGEEVSGIKLMPATARTLVCLGRGLVIRGRAKLSRSRSSRHSDETGGGRISQDA